MKYSVEVPDMRHASKSVRFGMMVRSFCSHVKITATKFSLQVTIPVPADAAESYLVSDIRFVKGFFYRIQ
jgi:hypothetical protein